MQNSDFDCRITDKRAMMKNAVVFVIGFFGMIYFMCYQRICKDYYKVGSSHCKYVYFGRDIGDHMTEDKGVAAVWYTAAYAFLMIFSIVGLFNYCCSKLGCMKVYSVGIAVIYGCITLFDLITMTTVGQVYDGNQHLREFYVFQVFLFWFMQGAIILSAAYDSFFEDRKTQGYVGKGSPEVVLVSA